MAEDLSESLKANGCIYLYPVHDWTLCDPCTALYTSRKSSLGLTEKCLECIYLYGVRLVMLDGLSAPQRPGEGKLRGGWVFISLL